MMLTQITYGLTIQYNHQLTSINDLWRLSIVNDEFDIVYFKGTITNKQAGLIYNAQTNSIQLPKGNHELKHYHFDDIYTNFSSVEDVGQRLPEGNYTFQVEAIKYENNQSVGRVSLDVFIVEEDSSLAIDDTTNKKFVFKINGSNTAQYNFDFKTEYQEQNYNRLIINPSIKIFEIPFTANINLIKDEGQSFRSANHYNINFNYYEYLNAVRNLVVEKTKENKYYEKSKSIIEDEKTERLRSELKDHDKWIEQLKDPTISKAVNSFDQIEPLRELKNSKEIQEKLKHADKLEKVLGVSSLEDVHSQLQDIDVEQYSDHIKNDKLKTVLENKEVVSQLKTNGTDFINQLESLKKLDDPNQFIDLVQSNNIEVLNKELADVKEHANGLNDKSKGLAVDFAKQNNKKVTGLLERFSLQERLSKEDIELLNKVNTSDIDDVQNKSQLLQLLKKNNLNNIEGKVRTQFDQQKKEYVDNAIKNNKGLEKLDEEKLSNLRGKLGDLNEKQIDNLLEDKDFVHLLESKDKSGFSKKLNRLFKSKEDLLDEEKLKDIESYNVNDVSKEVKVLEKLPLSELQKYESLLKDVKNNKLNIVDELGNDVLEKLLEKYSREELVNAHKLIKSGVDDYDKFKEIGSVAELQQLINVRKEYQVITDRLEKVVSKKKSYKKLLKAKKKIDEIENINIREIAKDPKKIMDVAEDYDLLSPAMKIFSDFRVLEAGYVYPIYNKLMLNGIRNKGFNIEMAPKKIYTGVTYGKTDFVTTSQDSIANNGKRNIGAIKFGIGEKSENHIHLNYLNGVEKNVSEEEFHIKRINHVVGVDFVYALLKKIQLNGEANFALLNGENRNTDLTSSFVEKGWAYSIILKYLFSNGEIYGGTENISTNYTSFGLPYLINDRITYEIGLRQALLNNKIALAANIKREHINGGGESENVKTNIGSVNLNYTPEKLPYISLFYTVIHLNNGISSATGLNNVSNQFNLTIGHNYKLKNSVVTTQVTYAYQSNNSGSNVILSEGEQVDINYIAYDRTSSNSVSISQQMQFGSVNVTLNGSMSHFTSADPLVNNLYSVNQTVSFPLFKDKMTAQFGSEYAKQGVDSKIGNFIQIGFNATKYLNFNFNVKNEFINNRDVEGMVDKNKGVTMYGQLNFNF